MGYAIDDTHQRSGRGFYNKNNYRFSLTFFFLSEGNQYQFSIKKSFDSAHRFFFQIFFAMVINFLLYSDCLFSTSTIKRLTLNDIIFTLQNIRCKYRSITCLSPSFWQLQSCSQKVANGLDNLCCFALWFAYQDNEKEI